MFSPNDAVNWFGGGVANCTARIGLLSWIRLTLVTFCHSLYMYNITALCHTLYNSSMHDVTPCTMYICNASTTFNICSN